MKSYDELLAERDALAAYNAELVKAIKAIENDCIECRYDDESGYFVGNDAISDACDLVHYKSPQQCLAEIKAEAGRAGFIAGYHKMHIEFVGSLASSEGAEFAANQYAAKISSTGTWLKDSNVNGGKRQGGTE